MSPLKAPAHVRLSYLPDHGALISAAQSRVENGEHRKNYRLFQSGPGALHPKPSAPPWLWLPFIAHLLLAAWSCSVPQAASKGNSLGLITEVRNGSTLRSRDWYWDRDGGGGSEKANPGPCAPKHPSVPSSCPGHWSTGICPAPTGLPKRRML